MWQNGPDFLLKPVTEWPISNDCNVHNLPDQVKITLVNEVTAEVNENSNKNSIGSVIDINKFNDFRKLMKVLES